MEKISHTRSYMLGGCKKDGQSLRQKVWNKINVLGEPGDFTNRSKIDEVMRNVL